MKYEAVFGDKYLADKFTNERSVFIVDRSGVYFEFEDGGAGVNYIANFCAIGDRYYMRRIIRTPTWSVADQKAGKLPGVGCRVSYLGIEYDVLAVDKHNVCFLGIDKELYLACISSVKPIESPEEKAQRLRSEWINKAYVDFHRIGCELEVLQKEQIKQIYDALLSGELTMPNKDGE